MPDSELPLGELLRTFRLTIDLTLERLSELSGVSGRTISDIERGVSIGPQHRTMEALCEALGLSLEQRTTLVAAARAGRRKPLAERDGAVVAPGRLPDFTGRADELRELVAFFTEASDAKVEIARAFVVCGAPGIGKTTLALEAMRRAKGREHYFVDLAGFDENPLAPLEVLQSLLRQANPAINPPTRLATAAAAWDDVVSTGPTSVILDNAASESQIRPVLSARFGTIIVTSRRSLTGIEGARRRTLEPLPLEDSIQLLLDILPPEQAASGDLSILAELCDSIPLAIRIAANRLASQPKWTIEDFIRRLQGTERRIRALVAGDLAVETTIALSYDLMTPEQADLFRALGVIDGPTFSATLVTAMMQDVFVPVSTLDNTRTTDVDFFEDALNELVDLGVVQSLGDQRYGLHDLLRGFAITRLRSDSTAQLTETRRDRLHAWLLRATSAAGRYFEPSKMDDNSLFTNAAEARSWLESEVEHWMASLRAASAAGAHGTLVTTVGDLHWFSDLWSNDGRWGEVFAMSVFSAHALNDKRLEAEHLGYLAWARIVFPEQGSPALDASLQAEAAAEGSGDDEQRGWAAMYVAWSWEQLEEFDNAVLAARRSVVAFERAQNVEGLAQATNIQAKLLSLQGRFEEAVAAHKHVVTIIRGSEISTTAEIAAFTESAALSTMAGSLIKLGRLDEALAAVERSQSVAESVDYVYGLGRAFETRADIEAVKGDGSPLDGYRRSLSIFTNLGRGEAANRVQEKIAALTSER